jgi:phosphopantothenoylcysteine decarboxylase/phosphopantothenate--cysteine ligase
VVSDVKADVAVMAAAVADFRPAKSHETKLARSDGLESIQLEATPDVLASVVARSERPYVVGFAADTGGVERAIEKAERKRVDLLVYNDVSEPGSGFNTDTNRVVFIGRDGTTESLPLLSKAEVAEKIWDRIASELNERE